VVCPTGANDLTKRVLLVGSNFSSVPLLLGLKRRGLHVAVCGNRPDEPCHAHADESLAVDYSDPNALLAAAQNGDFDFIVPTGNDVAYMSATFVAAKLGFPRFDSMETATIIHTKQAFRKFTDDHAIPAPRSIRLQKDQSLDVSGLHYPLLIKPSDSFSGRGVTKISDASGLGDAIDEARRNSRTAEVVIEEFVAGSLHSHSAFVKDQQIIFDLFVDEYCTVYPYQVDSSNHPSGLAEPVRAKIREIMGGVVRLLGLADGLLHTQFLSNGNDVWIIECMRRMPGDLYGSLVDQSLGIDYSDLVIQLALGESFHVTPKFNPPLPFGRHTITSDHPSIPFSFSHSIPAREVRIAQLKTTGKPMAAAPFDKLAILYARFNTPEEMLRISPDLKSFISLQTLQGDLE
jgi:biotin carboxylase